MKILFVCRSFEIGGAEKQMVLLLSHLRLRGYHCEVFAFQSRGELRDELLKKGITIYDGGLNIASIKKAPWRLISSIWRLIRTVRQTRPEIVQTALPLWTFLAAVVSRILHVPLTITCKRALGTHQDRYRLLVLLDRMANILSHKITVNSQAVWADTLERENAKKSKLVLIYNSVDPLPFEKESIFREKMRQELGLSPRETVIIAVANLIPYKGHTDLIEAARHVLDQVVDVTFLLVGEDRGIQAQLENRVRDLGIHEKVQFLGQRFDIPRLMAASDLSVLSSHEEGFSNVILESMAAGLPVVATCVGGNPEAIVDGVTGFLVPPHDPALLADRIIDLIQDTEKAKKWGQNGRERVLNSFTEQLMVEKYLALYQGHLSK